MLPRMKPARFLPTILGAAIILAAPAARAGVSSGPAATVQALYHTAFNHFGFSQESVKLEKPYVTDQLYARLWKAAIKPVPKGDAPDIEGDIFLNSQEPPTSFDIGEVSVHGDEALVQVLVNLPGDNRKYLVLLKNVGGAWKVADVDFGGDGKLTGQL